MKRWGLSLTNSRLAIACASMAIGMAVSIAAVKPASADIVELVPDHSAFSVLMVENQFGNVEVRGYDGDTIVVESAKSGAQSKNLRVAVAQGMGGVVSVRTIRSGEQEMASSPTAGRVDIRLLVPHAVHVQAKVGRGRLQVAKLDRGAQLTANEGTIDVSSIVGDLQIDSTTATPTVRMVVGRVDAELLRGVLTLEDIRGPSLEASVHEGAVIARKVLSQRTVFRVFRGNVTLDAEAQIGGDIRVAVHEGDIFVNVTPRGNLVVRTRGTQVTMPGGGAFVADSWQYGAGGQGTNITLVATKIGNIRVGIVE